MPHIVSPAGSPGQEGSPSRAPRSPGQCLHTGPGSGIRHDAGRMRPPGPSGQAAYEDCPALSIRGGDGDGGSPSSDADRGSPAWHMKNGAGPARRPAGKRGATRPDGPDACAVRPAAGA
ncbi:hypothetical protein DESPIGER_1374 [Desulfovibrio piger]|uniref:Uncharacterized protein n=1 Tax=Desulfovibrio piger TaxID=901 RepID=A0A1K1LEQ0_9BACT|nr:hypothetical protein DESPIGER_1374 [Desulfovibrio piger]